MMRDLRRPVLVTATAILMLGFSMGPAAAASKVYFSGDTVQQVYRSGGIVTSNKNISVGGGGMANAYSRVGGVEVFSTTNGVVQTYATKKAKVECGWANKNWSKTVKIYWSCEWRR